MTALELLTQIADKAVEVREHQRLYFKVRSPRSLDAAKKAERELDTLLAIRHHQRNVEQTELVPT